MTFPFPITASGISPPELFFSNSQCSSSSGTTHTMNGFDLGDTKNKKVVVVAHTESDTHTGVTVNGETCSQVASYRNRTGNNGGTVGISIWDVNGSFGGPNNEVVITTSTSSSAKGASVYYIDNGTNMTAVSSNTQEGQDVTSISCDYDVPVNGISICGYTHDTAFSTGVFDSLTKDGGGSFGFPAYGVGCGSNTFVSAQDNRNLTRSSGNAPDASVLAVVSYEP